MIKRFKFISSILLMYLAILACNLPSKMPTQSVSSELNFSTLTPTFTSVDFDSATATAAAFLTQECTPGLTTNQDANVRSGPSQVYKAVGVIPKAGTALIAGRNAEGTWWYIEFPAGENGHAWIAGSITSSNCIPSSLAVIVAPPTPVNQPQPTHTARIQPTNSQPATQLSPTLTSPAPNLLFKVVFDSVWYCGNSARISVRVFNQGNLNIESVMYSVETGGLYINGGTINNAPFEATATEPQPACAQGTGHGQSFLAPGESAYVPINISSVPASGTEGFLYIEACTNENRAGTCDGRVIYFKF